MIHEYPLKISHLISIT